MMVYSFNDIVIDSRTGLNPRKNFSLGEGNNYYVTIKDIYNGKVNFTDKTDRVDDNAIQIIKRRSRIKVGDVLFLSIGRIGETAIVTHKDDSWDVNESVFIFTLNEKIITPEYFCILFQSNVIKQHLTGNSSGSTFKSIKMNQLERMSFDLPTIAIQKSIVTKIAVVRRLIELRNRQLNELNNLIKARFVEMFGDAFINDKGWLVSNLGKYMTLLTDFSANGSYELLDSNVVMHDEPDYAIMVRTTDLEANDFSNNVKYIDEKAYELLSKSKLYGGELIMNKIGSAGRIYLMPYLNRPASLGRNAFMFRFDKRINITYLYMLLTSEYGTKEIQQYVRGAVTKTITKDSARAIKIIVPPIELQNEFADFVKQIDKSKLSVQKSLEKLETLQKALMQKYFG